VTNTCANVVLTPGDVLENGVVTTSVIYENGADDVVLTFDAFAQSIDYCPVIYTVHLLSMEDVEVTWNREDNPLVNVPPYDAVPDSDFSSQPPSSEYLTISRPEGSTRGTITISNTGGLETYVDSYKLQLRAHHQDVVSTYPMTHTVYNC